MLRKMLVVSCFATLAACGSDKSSTNTSADAGTTQETGDVTPIASASKIVSNASTMTEQATASSQSEADRSETATTGTDDSSGGYSKAILMGHGGGQLGINPTPGIDFNVTLTADFNVALDFNQYVGPDHGIANGIFNAQVRHGMSGSANVTFEGSTVFTYSNGNRLYEATAPTLTVTKQGTRASGQVVRTINGAVNRALTSVTNPNSDFNVIISHQGSTVTDAYTHNALSSRSIAGTTEVTDTVTGDTATITYNNVVRPAPSVCLCPTQGSITTVYNHGGTMHTITHTFGSTCGQVMVEDTTAASATATAASKAADTAVSSTAATSASVSAQVSFEASWKSCSAE